MAAESGSPSSGSTRHEFKDDAGLGEYAVTNLELKKGKVPKLTSDRIYSQTILSRLNFREDYAIKTCKEWFSLNNEGISLTLLTQRMINKYQARHFLHVGFIQVSIKTLARLGPNASMAVTLMDRRHANLKESILVAFESSLSMDSPVNFNLYPDVSYFLPRLRSTQALVLNVQPHGCDMNVDSKHLVVSYKMCYKVMKTILDPQPLIKGPRLEIDTKKSNLLVPTDNGDGGVLLQARKIDKVSS